MYNALKMQISLGNFKMREMRNRIERLYAIGAITDIQMDDLFNLMVEKANPEMERPEIDAMLQTIIGMLTDLDSRLSVLEGSDTVGSSGEGGAAEYPAWEPWNGVSNQYQPGAVVSHRELLWESVYSGQNVWEPGIVDERFWVKYIPSE